MSPNPLLVLVGVPLVVLLLQWAARRFLGLLGSLAVTAAVTIGLIWIAFSVIPGAVAEAKRAGTCFNCDMSYYSIPFVLGYAAFFVASGVAIAVRSRAR